MGQWHTTGIALEQNPAVVLTADADVCIKDTNCIHTQCQRQFTGGRSQVRYTFKSGQICRGQGRCTELDRQTGIILCQLVSGRVDNSAATEREFQSIGGRGAGVQILQGKLRRIALQSAADTQ